MPEAERENAIREQMKNMCQVGMPLCMVAPGWSFYGDNNNCTFGSGRRGAETVWT
jgi:hypothetical protein